jgi:hypothetical protein
MEHAAAAAAAGTIQLWVATAGVSQTHSHGMLSQGGLQQRAVASHWSVPPQATARIQGLGCTAYQLLTDRPAASWLLLYIIIRT